MKTKPKITRSPLRWDSSYDENNNTVLEAVGGTTDNDSGDLYYRIKQELQDNNHYWVEASSPELMMDEGGPVRWHKKNSALQAIQRHHDRIMADFLKLTPEAGREGN